jgi:hypothetical protein
MKAPATFGANPCGSSAGSTQRVAATATTSPVIENSPNWASPVNPENSIALKPRIEVSTPRRSVGHIRSSAARGGTPGAECVNR